MWIYNNWRRNQSYSLHGYIRQLSSALLPLDNMPMYIRYQRIATSHINKASYNAYTYTLWKSVTPYRVRCSFTFMWNARDVVTSLNDLNGHHGSRTVPTNRCGVAKLCTGLVAHRAECCQRDEWSELRLYAFSHHNSAEVNRIHIFNCLFE